MRVGVAVGPGVGAATGVARAAGTKTGSPELWLSMTVANARSLPPGVVVFTSAHPSATVPNGAKTSFSWRKPYAGRDVSAPSFLPSHVPSAL